MLKILTFIIDIGQRFEMTQGQGHKVKVKVKFAFVKKMCFFPAIDHKRMDGC